MDVFSRQGAVDACSGWIGEGGDSGGCFAGLGYRFSTSHVGGSSVLSQKATW